MFYALSKLGFFLIQPSSLCILLLIAGLLLSAKPRFHWLGRRLSVAGVAALLIFGLSQLGTILILPLEQRFPRPALASLGSSVAGIIVLGGLEEGRITAARGTLSLNEAGDRLTDALLLAHRFPQARVVFTGGAGTLIGEGETAAAEVGEFLVAAGIERARMVLEDRSRNTIENAVMTKTLVQPKPDERWLLVTSAFHMPRSVGTFRKAGFAVIGWPTDYRAAGWGDAIVPSNSLDNGLRRMDTACKEYIGLLAYWLRGWTDTLWPGPASTMAAQLDSAATGPMS